ncbi:MAG: site-specific integrase [Acidobacteriia bacterium]|nr:site-specific integrase [Terriglobia bacterium]
MIHSSPSNSAPIAADTTLEQSFKIYLERRQLQLKPRTLENYRFHFRYLVKFFGAEKPLSSLHEAHFRDYQKWRSTEGEGRGRAGASCINHELNALAQVLALADLWHPISRYYERLPESNWAPARVLTTEEEERFFRFASQRPVWKTACYASLLTANTTISGCELRALRLAHLRLKDDPPVIQVAAPVKNQHRVRGVPLNEVAVRAAQELLKVAKEHGSCEPHHYLIAYRVKRGLYDPERPASSCFIRAAFKKIASAAGLPWVTPTCFRHQAITKLLECGAPDETVRAIAGHVSEKAVRYYSHIRVEAKKVAVDRLVAMPTERDKARRATGKSSFPMLAGVKENAKRLGIPVDAALELLLAYEGSKVSGS